MKVSWWTASQPKSVVWNLVLIPADLILAVPVFAQTSILPCASFSMDTKSSQEYRRYEHKRVPSRSTDAHWGYRTNTFWKKLHNKRHARTECFPKSGTFYHLFTRRLYRQIDRENIRNRRQHEIEFIQRRIGMLDFVLSHPQLNYLETEPEKSAFSATN
jgi:hypothetical protein